MKIEYSCLTDKGIVREINEDSILCKDQIINMQDHYESEKIAEELLSEFVFLEFLTMFLTMLRTPQAIFPLRAFPFSNKKPIISGPFFQVSRCFNLS